MVSEISDSVREDVRSYKQDHPHEYWFHMSGASLVVHAAVFTFCVFMIYNSIALDDMIFRAIGTLVGISGVIVSLVATWYVMKIREIVHSVETKDRAGDV